MGNLLLWATRRAIPSVIFIMALGAFPLVLAPGSVVILYLYVYPLPLALAYGLIGWHIGRATTRERETNRLIPWRGALAVGGGAAVTLTLAILACSLICGLALSTLYVLSEEGAGFIEMFGLTFLIIAIYVFGGTFLGVPIASLGAWVTLRRRSLPTQRKPAAMP